MEKPQDCTWCHIEIPVGDPEAAKRFYGEVFGWQFQDIPEMEYTLYTTREGEMGGGIMKRHEGVPQQMVNYLCVDDIGATLERIQNHGGKVVHPEMPVGNVGWAAWASDPDGNLFALWKGNPEGHEDK
ncbi:MAG: VOC family protein [Planctomycetota bacterium]|jgi:predicted enzyme related to lactoylglutathione lyase